MIFEDLTLAGAVLIDLEPLEDERGFFARSYHDDEFAANRLNIVWPQHNISYNADARTGGQPMAPAMLNKSVAR